MRDPAPRNRSRPIDPLVAIALGAAAGGFVQGLSGFAFGLVAMTVWAWTLEPKLAAGLVVFGSLLGQVLGVGALRPGFDVRLILPMVAGGVAGVPLGVALLQQIDPNGFRLAVGVVLLCWCSAMLSTGRLPRVARGGRAADTLAGLVGGVMGGLGGLTGPAPTLWSTLRGWPRDTQRAVVQTFGIVMHSLTMTMYVTTGVLSAHSATNCAVAAVAMLVPALVGARLYRRFSDTGFRKIVLMLLAASGAVLIGTTLPRFV